MVIFHSYVNLPEGRGILNTGHLTSSGLQTWKIPTGRGDFEWGNRGTKWGMVRSTFFPATLW